LKALKLVPREIGNEVYTKEKKENVCRCRSKSRLEKTGVRAGNLKNQQKHNDERDKARRKSTCRKA
jgi:hypothetical protein